MKISLSELEAKLAKHPVIIVFTFGILTLLFSYFTIIKTNIDNDVTTMIPKDNPVKVYDEKTSQILGETGGIAIAIENSNGIFNIESIKLIDNITKTIEKIDSKIEKESLYKILYDLTDEERDGFIQFLNEKSFEFQTPEELKNLIIESEVSMYYSGDFSKIEKIKNDSKRIKQIFSILNSYTDENNKYKKRIRKVTSLTNVDAVFSEFTETEKITRFYSKIGVNEKKGVELSNYMLEKGITDKEKVVDFIKSKIDNIKEYFNLTEEEIKILKSLNEKEITELVDTIIKSEKLIRVSNLVDFEKLSENPDKTLFLIEERLKSWELYKDSLYSNKNPNSTLITIELYPQLLKEEREKVIQYVEREIKELLKDNKNIKYYIAGEPVIITTMGNFMLKDLVILFPIVLLVLIIFLYLSFMHIRGVILPLITVVLSTIWTLGTIAILGKSISIVSTALPVLLVAIGSAYGIHIIHHYYEDRALGMDKEEALKKTIKDFGMGVIMAGLTTFAGFATLSTNSVIPLRDFGIFAALGVLYALLISMILIPALLRIGRLPKKIKEMNIRSEDDLEKEIDKTTTFLRKLSEFFFKKRKKIILVYTILIIVSFIGAYFIKVEINVIDYFKKDTKIYQDDKFIRENFAGTSTLNIIIDTNKQNGILDVDLLKEVEKIQETIEGYENVGKVTSIVDFIKKMHETMNYGKKEFYKIPDEIFDENGKLISLDENTKKDKLKSIILSYIDQYDREDTRLIVDSEKQMLKISVILKTGSTIATKNVTEKIRERVKTLRHNIGFSGVNPLYLEVNNLIVNGQVWSIISSAIMVAILVAIMFKSIFIGSISILPLIVAIIFNFAIMAIFNVHLDVATAIISNIAIGTGVDYTIHFLNGYTILRKKGEDKEKAIINTSLRNGKAILINAISVAAGFLVLCFSSFKPLINVGWIIALTMITTSFLALTLVPVLLGTFNIDKKILGGEK
ncbi:MAG TPA: MMPL family transporter [Spirochaetota bacterium]|nr:MMPL family transporter [Spirochaetota bacterium]HOM37726.1 MMPL family transporter [Spirochaetota bacterium]HPQ49684.1 MMPL family transporter [Spirochaetota bacterium]